MGLFNKITDKFKSPENSGASFWHAPHPADDAPPLPPKSKGSMNLPPLDDVPHPSESLQSHTELPPLAPLDKPAALVQEDNTASDMSKMPPLPHIEAPKPEMKPTSPLPSPSPSSVPPPASATAPLQDPIFHDDHKPEVTEPKPKKPAVPSPPPKPHLEPKAPKAYDIAQISEIYRAMGETKTPEINGLSRPSTPPSEFFINVEDYRDIISGVQTIKSHVKDSEAIIIRLNELKDREDQEFEKWRKDLEDIQKKLVHIDKVVFEAG